MSKSKSSPKYETRRIGVGLYEVVRSEDGKLHGSYGSKKAAAQKTADLNAKARRVEVADRKSAAAAKRASKKFKAPDGWRREWNERDGPWDGVTAEQAKSQRLSGWISRTLRAARRVGDGKTNRLSVAQLVPALVEKMAADDWDAIDGEELKATLAGLKHWVGFGRDLEIQRKAIQSITDALNADLPKKSYSKARYLKRRRDENAEYDLSDALLVLEAHGVSPDIGDWDWDSTDDPGITVALRDIIRGRQPDWPDDQVVETTNYLIVKWYGLVLRNPSKRALRRALGLTARQKKVAASPA